MPTLSSRDAVGPMSRSTRPILRASAPKACITTDGPQQKSPSPSRGRCRGTRRTPPCSGPARLASARLRRVRSSSLSTRCALPWSSRTASPRTECRTRPPRPSFSPSLSASLASVVRRAAVPPLHRRPPSDPPRPALRRSPRLYRSPSLATWLSSPHTPSYSTLMEILDTMIRFPCRFTRPPWRCSRSRGMSARMGILLAKIRVSSRALHP